MDDSLRAYLRCQDILLPCERIVEYVSQVTKEEFSHNYQLQDAVTRRIEIIGEASRAIPQEVKDEFSDVPWRKLIGMRNIVIHEYRSTDDEIIYNVATAEILELKELISKMHEELECRLN